MTKKNGKSGKLFVISAPSGGGKTTLAHRVIETLRSEIQLTKVITYTSRTKRNNEQNHQDYHFVSRDEFLQKKAQGFFLETTEYNGEYYGSPASIKEDLQAGKSLLIVTDRPGAQTYSKLIPESILIWIMPPNLNVLKERIQNRGTENPQEIEKRLVIAKQEIAAEQQHRIFKHWVINNMLQDCITEIAHIIKQELALA